MIVPELNAPPSATIACALVSLFVQVTVEPTEMLIGFGVNPLPAIEALMFVGVGVVGELDDPHATAAVNAATAKVIFRKDMLGSFPFVVSLQTSGLRVR